MRLLNFLNEHMEQMVSWPELSQKEFLNILKTKCKNNLEKIGTESFPLYVNCLDSSSKYAHYTGDYIINDRNLMGKNYYYILFSEILKSWKNIPTLNKSLKCHVDSVVSQWPFGDSKLTSRYLVIPYDGSELCLTKSLWNILENNIICKDAGIKTLEDLCNIFYDLDVENNKTEIKKFLYADILEFWNENRNKNSQSVNVILYLALRYMVSGIKERIFNCDVDALMDIHKDLFTGIKLYHIFDYIVNPDFLDIMKTQYDNFLYKDYDIWLDSNSLLIKVDGEYDNFMSFIDDLKREI